MKAQRVPSLQASLFASPRIELFVKPFACGPALKSIESAVVSLPSVFRLANLLI